VKDAATSYRGTQEEVCLVEATSTAVQLRSMSRTVATTVWSPEVTDEGSGIPMAQQKRIFEPFFTTRDPGKGTAFGFSLVYSIVKELVGSVTVESPIGTVSQNGTRVIVTFPCYDPWPSATP